MGRRADHLATWVVSREWVLIVIAGALALGSIPIALGHIGLSWDGLNHHIYLGWSAEHNRFDNDYLAASYQAYTFPYLYWPVYRLALAGASGITAGIVLAMIHVMAVPAIWLLARTCIPGSSWFDLTMRWLAVALAFMSGVVLSFFDSTANDLSAAIPLLWSVALAFQPWDAHRPRRLRPHRALLLSGFLAGVSVAFKLSNGPIAILLPLVWIAQPGTLRDRLSLVLQACVLSAVGFAACYGYWGVQLWTHFGNPIYPFYDSWFEPVRALAGWSR